jgi:glycerophosphoryl diester phosphodiesterase
MCKVSVFRGDPPVVIGHRGAPRRARENTPAAFAAAAADGAAYVELDVRRCADGLVVHHDPMTADGTAILGCTVAELDALGVWELGAVLAGLPEGLGVDAELKNLPGEPDYDEADTLAVMVAPYLAKAAAERPVCATSFNPGTVAALDAPGVPRGLVAGPGLRAASAGELARDLSLDLVCPHVDAPGLDQVLPALRDSGLAVMVWVVDDPARARALATLGADAICTNDPAGISAALA